MKPCKMPTKHGVCCGCCIERCIPLINKEIKAWKRLSRKYYRDKLRASSDTRRIIYGLELALQIIKDSK